MASEGRQQPIDTQVEPNAHQVNNDDEKHEHHRPEQEQLSVPESSDDRARNKEEDGPILPISAPSNKHSTDLLPNDHPDAGNAKWDMQRLRAFLREDVDTDAATGPLAAFCFMTVCLDYICDCSILSVNTNFWPSSPFIGICA